MFLILLAIFIIVPLLELWVIFTVGSQIGYALTFLILIMISVLGAALARYQGYRVLVKIQQEISNGRVPGDSLIDGALILSGALMLLTPGFITDAVGLLILLPPTRKFFKSLLKGRLNKAAARRTVFFRRSGWGGPGGPGPGGPGGGPQGGYGSEPEQRRKELED